MKKDIIAISALFTFCFLLGVALYGDRREEWAACTAKHSADVCYHELYR